MELFIGVRVRAIKPEAVSLYIDLAPLYQELPTCERAHGRDERPSLAGRIRVGQSLSVHVDLP